MTGTYPADDSGTCDRCGAPYNEGDPIGWLNASLCCQGCFDDIGACTAGTYPAGKPGTCDECGTAYPEGTTVGWFGKSLCCTSCLNALIDTALSHSY